MLSSTEGLSRYPPAEILWLWTSCTNEAAATAKRKATPEGGAYDAIAADRGSHSPYVTLASSLAAHIRRVK